MSGYTPVFSTMYDGTLCGKWPTAAVWASLLPLIDAHGEIRMTYDAIHRRTGWPMDLLREGITALMQPDPDSQSPAEDGRRLVLIDPARNWGWRAVNHQKYREKARKHMHDRARVLSGENEERMRERREAQPEQSLTRDDPPSPVSTRDDRLSDSDSDSDSEEEYIEQAVLKRSKRKSGPAAKPLEPEELGQFRLTYPRRAGSQPWRRAIACIRTRLHEGHTWQEIIQGAQRYRAFCVGTNKVATEFVMQVATFVGPEKHFLAAWDLPAAPSAKQTAEQTSLQRMIERRAAIGLTDFRLPLHGESAADYRRAQDDEWDRRKVAQSLRNSSLHTPSLGQSIELARQMAVSLKPLGPPIGRRRQP